MQQRFKKVRKGWMEELLATLAANSIIACEFTPLLRLYANHHFKFEVKGSSRTLSPPEIAIQLDPEIAHTLYDKALRMRKTYHANLLAESLESPIATIEEIQPQLFEGEEESIEEYRGFKIGVALVREEGNRKTRERIERELRHCSERSGAKFSSQGQRGRQSELWHLLSRLVRMFLAVEERQKKLKIARLLYYPKVDLQIHKVRITPFSFIENEVLRKIKAINYSKELIHGYVALNRCDINSPLQFIMLDPHEFQANPVPLVGVFLGGRLGGQLKLDSLLWTVVMEYLSNPLASNKRLGLSGERTGFIFVFQEKAKSSSFQFEVPASARWKLSTGIQSYSCFPRDIVFPTREVIIEEDREESEVESVQSKQQFPLQEGPADSISSRSFDQKDQEIARLKSELDHYKHQCAWLTQLVTSLSLQKATTVPTYPLLYPLTNNTYPPINNNTFPSINTTYPPSINTTAFPSINNTIYPSVNNSTFQPINSSNFQPNFNQPINNSMQTMGVFNPDSPTQPFYGNQPSQEAYFMSQKQGRGQKQFKIKDSKNISFAQQNSYEEQIHTVNLLQDESFQSPQFNLKTNTHLSREVRPFEMPRSRPQQPLLPPERREQAQPDDYLQSKNSKSKTSLDYKNQKPIMPRSQLDTEKYSRNIPESGSNLQKKLSDPNPQHSITNSQHNFTNSQHSISNQEYQPSSPIKTNHKYFPPEKAVSSTKLQRGEFEGQRSKAIGSIAPKENNEIHKKYLSQQGKPERRQTAKKGNGDTPGKEQQGKGREQQGKGREQQIKGKQQQGKGKEEKKYRHLMDSQSQDDELHTIITSRNRKK